MKDLNEQEKIIKKERKKRKKKMKKKKKIKGKYEILIKWRQIYSFSWNLFFSILKDFFFSKELRPFLFLSLQLFSSCLTSLRNTPDWRLQDVVFQVDGDSCVMTVVAAAFGGKEEERRRRKKKNSNGRRHLSFTTPLRSSHPLPYRRHDN